jgi:hypothetical protein
MQAIRVCDRGIATLRESFLTGGKALARLQIE